jgi:hypothetical protein
MGKIYTATLPPKEVAELHTEAVFCRNLTHDTGSI